MTKKKKKKSKKAAIKQVRSYPFEEFIEHYEAFQALPRPETPSIEWSLANLTDLLKPRYPKQSELIYKVTRFMSVMMYIADNMADFDVGEYAVQGSYSSGSLINENILRAVHEAYCLDDPFPARKPSPEQILHRARQFRDLEPGSDA